MGHAATNQGRPFMPRRTRSEEIAAQAVEQGREEAAQRCPCTACTEQRLEAAAADYAYEIADPTAPLADPIFDETDLSTLFRLGVAFGVFLGIAAGVPLAFIAMLVFVG